MEDGAVEGPPKVIQLPLSADHRPIEASAMALAPDDVLESEGDDGLRLSLEFDRLRLADVDRIAHEVAGPLANENFPGRRGLLEPARDGDGVSAEGRPLVARGGNGLAGVHPDPHLDASARDALQVLVDRLQRRPNL